MLSWLVPATDRPWSPTQEVFRQGISKWMDRGSGLADPHCKAKGLFATIFIIEVSGVN